MADAGVMRVLRVGSGYVSPGVRHPLTVWDRVMVKLIALDTRVILVL